MWGLKRRPWTWFASLQTLSWTFSQTLLITCATTRRRRILYQSIWYALCKNFTWTTSSHFCSLMTKTNLSKRFLRSRRRNLTGSTQLLSSCRIQETARSRRKGWWIKCSRGSVISTSILRRRKRKRIATNLLGCKAWLLSRLKRSSANCLRTWATPTVRNKLMMVWTLIRMRRATSLQAILNTNISMAIRAWKFTHQMWAGNSKTVWRCKARPTPQFRHRTKLNTGSNTSSSGSRITCQCWTRTTRIGWLRMLNTRKGCKAQTRPSQM